MKYIPPNPENGTCAQVETAMKATSEKRHFIRLQAIRLLLLKQKPSDVANTVMRTERTIRNWISFWNYGGLDLLLPKPVKGRPRLVGDEDKKRIINLLEHPEEAEQSHWTAKKIHGHITREWSLELGYSTLTRNFRQWGFRLKVPRPWPVQQDEELREIFRQDLSELLDKDDHEVWFCDETGILGDPRPRRRWMKKGEKGTVPFSGLHLRSNVVGAVHPKTGELFSLIVSHMDTDMFQVFLTELAKETKARKVILILDNATWHKVKKLKWYNIEAKYLPPYSPDLNPIEELWLVLKKKFFTDWIAKDQEQLEERVVEALKSFIFAPKDVASICKV